MIHTWLAMQRFNPTPPHFNDMRRHLGDLSSSIGRLKSLIVSSLSSCFIDPTYLAWGMLRRRRKILQRSMYSTNCEKTMIFCEGSCSIIASMSSLLGSIWWVMAVQKIFLSILPELFHFGRGKDILNWYFIIDSLKLIVCGFVILTFALPLLPLRFQRLNLQLPVRAV